MYEPPLFVMEGNKIYPIFAQKIKTYISKYDRGICTKHTHIHILNCTHTTKQYTELQLRISPPCFMCVAFKQKLRSSRKSKRYNNALFCSFHLSHTLSHGLSHGSSRLTIFLTGVLNNNSSLLSLALVYSHSTCTRDLLCKQFRSLFYKLSLVSCTSNLHHKVSHNSCIVLSVQRQSRFDNQFHQLLHLLHLFLSLLV